MTKTNLTLLTIGLVAASLLASCKKNNSDNGGTADGQGFKASIEQSSDSRTHGEVGVNDNVVNVKWTAADQILVANNADDASASTTLTYELTEGENTGDGIFYTGQPHDDFFHPNYAAIYPNVNSKGTANSISGKNATFNLPATQTYSGSNVFAEKVVPMVAYSTSQTLQFKNACGGLRFPMVGSNVTVQSVELTTTTFNTNDHLCGVFKVDCSSNDPTLAWQNGGGNTITIECGSGIALGTTPTYFYFMLPPGTLHGLSLTAYDGSRNVVYSVESSRDYLIERNKIKKVDANLEIPLKVTTASPTYITTTSAKGGVSVANGTATETGICWGTTNIPDINGSHATGTTEINMAGLTPNTIYYVRAYAKSAQGTYYYGESIPFASRDNYVNGKLPGAFHTAANEVCYFSMGNLQYQASTNTWRYAKRQFDYVGYEHNVTTSGTTTMMKFGTVVDNGVRSNNDLAASTYSGWVDVFQWGTSNISHGAIQYQPWIRWHNDSDASHYYAYANKGADLYSSNGQADWGANTILNGGSNAWPNKFTPSSTQIDYLLHNRTGERFAFARIQVNDTIVRGIMLFPDDFTWPNSVTVATHINDDNGNIPFDGAWWPTGIEDFSTYTEREWSLLEHVGVVFLPCAGCWGAQSEMDNWGNYSGRYWLSDHYNDGQACAFAFSPQHKTEGVVSAKSYTHRAVGFSVRLMIK